MKKYNFIKLISICVLSAFLFVTPFSVSATDATVKSYEDKLNNISYKIEQAKNELSSIRSQQSQTWVEINKLDELIDYNEQLKELTEKQLDAIVEQIADTENNISELEDKIDSQETAFLDRMVEEYMEQDTDYLELILGSKNLVDFLVRIERISAILDYDKTIISNLEENKQKLSAEQEKLDEAKKTQESRVADYDNAISSSQEAYQDKLDLMATLEANETSSLNTYTYYKDLEDQLNNELEWYLAELQRKSQSTYVGGTGGWPLQAGVNYYVSSEFGWRVLWGANDYHYGIDLACANGTEIYSYNAGTVIKSEFHYSYGNYVLVDHGGGISTLYAHMSSRVAQVGDYVSSGQLLGYVGMTGSASGYHLHFEVRENGSVVEPRNYLYFP